MGKFVNEIKMHRLQKQKINPRKRKRNLKYLIYPFIEFKLDIKI